MSYHYHCDRCGKFCTDKEVRIVSNDWLKTHFNRMEDHVIGILCNECTEFLKKHPYGN